MDDFETLIRIATIITGIFVYIALTVVYIKVFPIWASIPASLITGVFISSLITKFIEE